MKGDEEKVVEWSLRGFEGVLWKMLARTRDKSNPRIVSSASSLDNLHVKTACFTDRNGTRVTPRKPVLEVDGIAFSRVGNVVTIRSMYGTIRGIRFNMAYSIFNEAVTFVTHVETSILLECYR